MPRHHFTTTFCNNNAHWAANQWLKALCPMQLSNVPLKRGDHSSLSFSKHFALMFSFHSDPGLLVNFPVSYRYIDWVSIVLALRGPQETCLHIGFNNPLLCKLRLSSQSLSCVAFFPHKNGEAKIWLSQCLNPQQGGRKLCLTAN